jgi:outer membrane protein insertion porin family
MRRLPGILLAALLSLLVLGPAPRAADPVVVKDIRLEGLQRISAGTVFNYLPIKVGDAVDDARTAEAIRALFKTGFFRDVRIDLEGATLVVFLVERPSIAKVEFTGNKEVETDKLLDQLKQIGFAEGRVFNRSTFESVEQELRRLYFNKGKYAVKIQSTVTPLERNRVGVRFDISEGKAARIKQINLVGNTAYSIDDLLAGFKSGKSGWFTWLTGADQYSRQQLAADLETLRSYYLDRGYVNFNIDSTQVSITPDKRDIYVTINVTEGERYTVKEIKLAGNLIVPEEELFKLVTVRRGEVFSRKRVTETTTKLNGRLGTEGYAFANVNAVPEIDEKGKQVALTFFVDPGKRVYVRRVTFKGNTKTRDDVLRREMRQLEGGWISTSAVERSRVRLERLGYFENVNVETPAVPGTTDQVDVNFTVTEKPSGNLLAGVGFSQSQGIVVNTSVTQENFLGTGNRVSATFNNSSINRTFSFSWLNPYWTLDGVSRGFDAYYQETDAADANLADYQLAELGGGISFGIPITELETVRVSGTVESIRFKVGPNASREINAFTAANGTSYIDFLLRSGWSQDSRNSRIFPDRGSLTSLSAELAVPGSDLQYYKLTGKHQHWFNIFESYAFSLEGEVGYGDGYGDTTDLPLLRNFFAGGIRSVRGFEANTLGPRDSRNLPLGGNLKVVGTAELVIPLPFTKDVRSVRMSGFVDAGTVYGPRDDIDLGEMRFSVGASVIWLSPVGALTFSLAAPFNTRSGDQTQPFQFTFGTSF